MNSTKLIRLDKINKLLTIISLIYIISLIAYFYFLATTTNDLSNSIIFILVLYLFILSPGLLIMLMHFESLYLDEYITIKKRCDKYHERIDFINDLNKINVAINNLTNK